MQKNITDYFINNSDFETDKIFYNDSEIQEILNIYTDGACSRNGYSNAQAGIGIYSENLLEISERIKGEQTNQRAELFAILKALESIDIKKYNQINIYTDSKYSISCITIWIDNWLKNNWQSKYKKPVKNKDIIKDIYAIYSKYNHINFIHIFAHTNKKDIHSLGNEKADLLARLSINNK
jgi:ribonuclease HI